jgi:hypothetical protein
MKIKPSCRRGSVAVELKRADETWLEKSVEAARAARPVFRLKRTRGDTGFETRPARQHRGARGASGDLSRADPARQA